MFAKIVGRLLEDVVAFFNADKKRQFSFVVLSTITVFVIALWLWLFQVFFQYFIGLNLYFTLAAMVFFWGIVIWIYDAYARLYRDKASLLEKTEETAFNEV